MGKANNNTSDDYESIVSMQKLLDKCQINLDYVADSHRRIENAYYNLILATFAFTGAGFFSADQQFSKKILALLICMTLLSLTLYLVHILHGAMLKIDEVPRLLEIIKKKQPNKSVTINEHQITHTFWSFSVRPGIWLLMSFLLLIFVIVMTTNLVWILPQ